MKVGYHGKFLAVPSMRNSLIAEDCVTTFVRISIYVKTEIENAVQYLNSH